MVELGPQLEDLRSKGLFCDVTMIFPQDGRKMHVHRNILASCSQYFRTLFTFNMTSSAHIEVEIPGVTYADMEAIVQFAYTHKADLNASNIESIIVTADRLNVLGLLKILRADDLTIDAEDYACMSVLKWVDFLPDVRTAYLPQLLRSVRLGLVSRRMYEVLMQKFSCLPTDSEPMYENESESYEHSLAYHAMVTVQQTLYVIGGYTTVKYLNSAKKFDPLTKIWSEIAPMHSSRCYVCAAEVGGFIYACGGFDGTNRHSSVERYCPVKNQWQMVREMTSVRSDAGACGVDVEKYYPDRGAWFPVKEMLKGRSNFAAAVIENRIFVVGGYDGSGTTGHVEYYESYKDEWTEADSLRVGRSAASACTIKGLDNIQDYTFYGKEARFLVQSDSFDWQNSMYNSRQSRSWCPQE
ncbi:unnamed protein product [Candidula unifasciata]|uniref:BTB domain-containing protein n=1 Tax=Candidula unifasciata TaxID=100452 RepID=A0A8S3ZBQ0_9EUPU|nr:unnamed protein product [Candidula unifasciata]